MKYVLIYLCMLILPMIGFGQRKADTLAYNQDDIVLRVLDTLYVPSDTSLTRIPYEMENNGQKTILFGMDYDREVYIPNKGWERIDFAHKLDSLKKQDALKSFFENDEIFITHAIENILSPGKQWDSKILFQKQDRLIYQAGKQYRIVKYFRFEGEEQWYYIWDKLVVKEAKK